MENTANTNTVKKSMHQIYCKSVISDAKFSFDGKTKATLRSPYRRLLPEYACTAHIRTRCDSLFISTRGVFFSKT